MHLNEAFMGPARRRLSFALLMTAFTTHVCVNCSSRGVLKIIVGHRYELSSRKSCFIGPKEGQMLSSKWACHLGISPTRVGACGARAFRTPLD